jgi:hypothetical protein
LPDGGCPQGGEISEAVQGVYKIRDGEWPQGIFPFFRKLILPLFLQRFVFSGNIFNFITVLIKSDLWNEGSSGY